MTACRQHFSRIGSTQTEALSHLSELKPAEWRLYTADLQTAGQGTHGRSWTSPKGNLYASYIFLLPKTATSVLPHISQIAAFSILETIKTYAITPSIKWINDILIDRQKIAGVLTQVQTIQNLAQDFGICVGIGININAEKEELKDIGQPATSLKICTQKEQNYDLEPIIESLSHNLKANIETLQHNGFSSFKNALEESLERFDNEPIIFDTEETANPRYSVGQITGLNDKGGLILRTSLTSQTEFISGKILRGQEIALALEEDDNLVSSLINHHHFSILPSTQRYARENMALLQQNHFWHLISAEEQTGGIGQAARTWSSPIGNLYATFMLPKSQKLTASKIQISETAALSVVEMLNTLALPAEIKWRNDVKIEEKKIAGNLVEIKGEGILIGIGLNINIDPGEYSQLDQETTSIKKELKKTVDLDVPSLLKQLQKKLYFNIQMLFNYGFSSLLEKINSHLRYKDLNVTITLDNGEKITGQQKNITPSGGILINTFEGEKEIMEGQLRPNPSFEKQLLC